MGSFIFVLVKFLLVWSSDYLWESSLTDCRVSPRPFSKHNNGRYHQVEYMQIPCWKKYVCIMCQCRKCWPKIYSAVRRTPETPCKRCSSSCVPNVTTTVFTTSPSATGPASRSFPTLANLGSDLAPVVHGPKPTSPSTQVQGHLPTSE
jgi:hypothetical protein